MAAMVKMRTRAKVVPAADLWRHKRARQAADLRAVEGGRVPAKAMSWFTEDMARRAKVDAPY